MFTTEGHIVSVDERFRNSLWQDILPGEEDSTEKVKPNELKAVNFSSNVRFLWCYWRVVCWAGLGS